MLLHDDDFTIVAKHQAQYYLLAQDVFRLGRLHWVMGDLAAQETGRQAPLDGQ
jgi:hypothetical protein